MNKLVSIAMGLLSSTLTLAAPETVENISDAVFLPLIEVIRPLFVKLSFVVGGLFGATLLLVFARIYYDRKTIKLLKAIKFDLDQVNKKMGIRYSSEPIRGFYRRLVEFMEDRAHKRALKQLHEIKQTRIGFKKKIKDKS